MNSFTYTTFGECLSMITNGATISQSKQAKGLPITRIETLSNDVFNRDRLGYADINDDGKYDAFILDDYDLLMSHINSREFLGRTVLYRKQLNEKIIHGMNLLRIKTNPSKLDSRYAYYWTKTSYFKKCIDNIRKDAVNQSSISISDIKNIIIPLPTIDEQIKVADKIEKIDNKIALNKAINQTLEKMAKLLYDYWFVQFDFPDKNGRPYKSSGGKMVYNEKLKREIPEGWGHGCLKDVLSSTVNSTSAGKHLKKLCYCPIDVIPKRKMSFAGGENYENAQSSLQLYEENDILIGAMRVYFHRCCIASEPGVTRTTTIVVKPNDKELLPYYYQVLNEDRTFDYAVKVSTGTQQPYVTWDSLSSYLIISPDSHLISLYCEKMMKLVELVKQKEKEIVSLTSLRDFLLPMLMNGQIKIKE